MTAFKFMIAATIFGVSVFLCQTGFCNSAFDEHRDGDGAYDFAVIYCRADGNDLVCNPRSDENFLIVFDNTQEVQQCLVDAEHDGQDLRSNVEKEKLYLDLCGGLYAKEIYAM